MIDPCQKSLAELRELGLNHFYHQLYEEGIEELRHLCSKASNPIVAMKRSYWDEIVDHLDCALGNCDDATLDELMEKYFGVYSNRYEGGGRAFFQRVQQVMIDALADMRSKF